MDPYEAKRIVDSHAAQLSEHFDAVQILASYSLNGGTQSISGGSGNWFARLGMGESFHSSAILARRFWLKLGKTALNTAFAISA